MDFIMLMHGDQTAKASPDLWAAYFTILRSSGAFEGGSSIGSGATFRKDGTPGATSAHLTGYIRITAADRAAAEALLIGNPVYECGGTVELRELLRD